MKIKLSNGVEMELSVEEFLSMGVLVKDEKENVKPKVKPRRKNNYVLRGWTHAERKILNANAKRPYKELMRLLPSRTKRAIATQISLYGLRH